MSDALDGEVGGWYGWYVRFHSHVCVPCRRMRRSLERTVSLLHRLRDEPGGDSVPDGGEPPH